MRKVLTAENIRERSNGDVGSTWLAEAVLPPAAIRDDTSLVLETLEQLAGGDLRSALAAIAGAWGLRRAAVAVTFNGNRQIIAAWPSRRSAAMPAAGVDTRFGLVEDSDGTMAIVAGPLLLWGGDEDAVQIWEQHRETIIRIARAVDRVIGRRATNGQGSASGERNGGGQHGDEHLFAMVASRSRVGIYVTVGGRYRFTNPQFEQMTGYTNGELRDREQLTLVDSREQPQVERTIHRQLLGGRSEAFEHSLLHRSGERRWVMETVTPIEYKGERAALGNVIDITERKQTEVALTRMAREDALTGLANRGHFLAELERAVTSVPGGQTRYAAVLYIDLDGFKQINDRYGHETGDQLLRNAGERILECVRPGDIVARLGGDEFTVLIEGLPGRSAADGIAERIVKRLEEPYRVAGRRVSTSASIGVASTVRGQATGMELLRAADAALYMAKRRGKNRYVEAPRHSRGRVA